MTEKDIINGLRNIKIYCGSQKGCSKCVFNTGEECQIIMLGKRLTHIPSFWNIDDIEEVLAK